MFTLLKWIALAFAASFLWLVGRYIAEYLAYNPYNKYALPKSD